MEMSKEIVRAMRRNRMKNSIGPMIATGLLGFGIASAVLNNKKMKIK